VRPRRTYESVRAIGLEGGNEDNDLWVSLKRDDNDYPIISSVWEPTDEERQQIAEGANIELLVWAIQTPPVAIDVTHVPLGKLPPDEEWPIPDEDPPDPL
jgi:hypothetical protein